MKKVSEAEDLGTKAEDSCLKYEKFGGIRRRWEFDEFMVELSIMGGAQRALRIQLKLRASSSLQD